METKVKSALSSFGKKVEPTTAAAKPKQVVKTDLITDAELIRIAELNSIMDNAEGELKMLKSKAGAIGRDIFADLYEKHSMRPESFIMTAGGTGKVMVIVQDKYLKLDASKASLLERYEGVLDNKTTYTLNAEIAERNGDAIVAALMASPDISQEDKENLLEVKEEQVVKKGTIDRLMQYSGWKGLLSLIEPVLMLKNAR